MTSRAILARTYGAMSPRQIMTGITPIRGLIVPERHNHRHPGIGGVTCLAQIAGDGMRSGFTRWTAHAIMAARLGASLAGDQGMIEYRPKPSRGGVTGIAR